MKQLNVSHEYGSYKIHIGAGLRHDITKYLPTTYRQVFVITDTNVAPLYLKDVERAFSNETTVNSFTVPAGESSKNLQQFYNCHTKAIEMGLDRNGLIIALGGGVIGDLAGYVAASYMRGIDYIQIPTTLLAHDSSVGGKVAINHELGKNLIGHFYQPEAVLYDTETLATLPNGEWRSGMAEVIKHAWISDKTGFLDECYQLENFAMIPNDTLHDLLFKGIQVKAEIVSEDEREKGIRSYLNFGHTLGHALEAELGYGTLTHGEAVAIGMDFALSLSEFYYTNDLERHLYRDWIKKHHYPLSILQEVQAGNLIQRMKRDKKNHDSEIRMVLLQNKGNPAIVPFDNEKLSTFIQDYIEEVSRVD